jgi:hypothetical protein
MATVRSAIRSAYATAHERFVAFDDALDAWAAQHPAALDTLKTVLAFAALSGGVALHAHESGLARALAADAPVAAAALCGLAAIAFAWVYVALTLGLQRAFIDPWTHVRPEPPPRDAAKWALRIYVLLGLVIFFVIAWLGGATPPARALDGAASMSVSGGGTKISIGAYGMLGLIFGWWIGGRAVLRFFWARARAAAERRARA